MGQLLVGCLFVAHLILPSRGRPADTYLPVIRIFLSTATRSKATCVF